MLRRVLVACLLVLLALAVPVSADTFIGTPKADRLVGTSGKDRIEGRGGNDRISGGRGNDTLLGGAGKDRLTGGPGEDTLLGGAGDDVLNSRDGARDSVYCGAGNDRVVADTMDVIAAGCEEVELG